MKHIVKKHKKELKIYKCNQCGETFFKSEMRYLEKLDGPYCKYCVKDWKNYEGESND